MKQIRPRWLRPQAVSPDPVPSSPQNTLYLVNLTLELLHRLLSF